MDKKRKIIATISPFLALLIFALAAMASSTASDIVNSPDFREGFERGWEYGTRLGSDATPEIQRIDVDSISLNQSEIALIN